MRKLTQRNRCERDLVCAVAHHPRRAAVVRIVIRPTGDDGGSEALLPHTPAASDYHRLPRDLRNSESARVHSAASPRPCPRPREGTRRGRQHGRDHRHALSPEGPEADAEQICVRAHVSEAELLALQSRHRRLVPPRRRILVGGRAETTAGALSDWACACASAAAALRRRRRGQNRCRQAVASAATVVDGAARKETRRRPCPFSPRPVPT